MTDDDPGEVGLLSIRARACELGGHVHLDLERLEGPWVSIVLDAGTATELATQIVDAVWTVDP